MGHPDPHTEKSTRTALPFWRVRCRRVCVCSCIGSIETICIGPVTATLIGPKVRHLADHPNLETLKMACFFMRRRDPQTYSKSRFQTGNTDDRYQYNFSTYAPNFSQTFPGYGPTLLDPHLGEILPVGRNSAIF